MMAKAIFTREFHWSRPRGLGFGAKAKAEPQSFPRDFIAAAVAAGAATEVPPQRKKTAGDGQNRA
ncbi:hypothetical protein [Defluviimonas sp. SAOS-178_SWC]|uniref:hypothetical protein n=1 Tax=Defluviimonas sp. SAOS-178_SWC TaxID=3121287 RepID=UPI0032214481